MKKVLILSLLLGSAPVYADLPLTVESLISDQGKFTLESGLIYGNSKSKETNVTGVVPIQVGTNAYINLPAELSQNERQTDYIVANVAMKYGINPKTDIGIRANGIYQSQRNLDVNTQNSMNTTTLTDVALTGSYQITEDAKYPAIVSFADLGVLEKRQNKNLSFSNLSIGLIAYRSYDPIVLSVTTGYKHYFDKKVNENMIKPSTLFFINPQVAFSANDRISLLAGFNLRYIGTQKVNNLIQSKQRNDTDIMFGMGYGLENNANINIIATLKQGFENSNEFRVSYSKKFK